MASCDVRATPSREDILSEKKKNDENSNVSEEDPAKDAHMSSSISSVTKIPGPVILSASGSFIQISNRQYTSVLGLEKLQKLKLEEMEEKSQRSECELNITQDSGVLMDSSALDISMAESESQLTNSPSPILQQILDAIPNSSSEMNMKMAEQQSLRELQRVVAEMEVDVATHARALELEMLKDLEEQMEAPEQQEKEEITDNEQKSLNEEEAPQPQQLEGVEKANQVEKSLNEQEALEPQQLEKEELVDQEQEESHEPQLEDEDTETDTNPLESESEQETIMGDQFELLDEAEIQTPAVEENEDVELVPLTAASSADGSSFRKMVRLEQLLDAENNIDLLRQLLDSDHSNDKRNDADPSNEPNVADPDQDKPKDGEEHSSFLNSLLQMLCSRKMVQLSYPVLFCGMAFGLIYFFRKV